MENGYLEQTVSLSDLQAIPSACSSNFRYSCHHLNFWHVATSPSSFITYNGSGFYEIETQCYLPPGLPPISYSI